MADIVLDFHSGGRTLDFVPFAAATSCLTRSRRRRALRPSRPCGAPFSMRMLEIDVGRHVRHGGGGDGQGLRYHRAWRRRHGDGSDPVSPSAALRMSCATRHPSRRGGGRRDPLARHAIVRDCFTFAEDEGLIDRWWTSDSRCVAATSSRESIPSGRTGSSPSPSGRGSTVSSPRGLPGARQGGRLRGRRRRDGLADAVAPRFPAECRLGGRDRHAPMLWRAWHRPSFCCYGRPFRGREDRLRHAER